MHIVFFADNFPPEGNAIASRVFERACYWVTWGHQVTVITSAPNFPEGNVYPGYNNKWYQIEIMKGIRVVRVKTFIAKNKGIFFRTLDFLSYTLPALIAGLWQKKPDVIVATTPQPFAALTAFLLAALRRLPFILEVADIWPASIVGVGAMQNNIVIRWLEKLELFLYRRSTAIVVLTAAFKSNLISRGINANKMTVIVNGVDLANYSPCLQDVVLAKQYHIHSDTFVVGYIGTHGMAHALENVLKAAELLVNNSKILFLFVGGGAQRDDLINLANFKQLINVKFIPMQPKNTIFRFWSLCHVALVHLKNDPVFSEVIPSKIFEAMGMGLPILLAAPKGEASNIVMQNQVGIWVPAEDPRKLAEGINYYYENPHMRKQWAIKSHQCANVYSRERQAKEMIVTIQKCCMPTTNIQHEDMLE